MDERFYILNGIFIGKYTHNLHIYIYIYIYVCVCVSVTNYKNKAG